MEGEFKVLKISSSHEIEKKQTEMLVIPVCEDSESSHPDSLANIIQQALSLKEFKGAENEAVVFFAPLGLKAKQVMFAGIGKKDSIDEETFRKACGSAIKKCIQKEVQEAIFIVPCASKLDLEPERMLSAMMEGAYLGNHQFDKYKKSKHPSLLKIEFAVSDELTDRFSGLAQKIKTICDGTILAREWVTIPSNLKRPEEFAGEVVKLAEKEGLKASVLDHKALKSNKFGALLAVSAGSASKPRVVILEHYPVTADKDKTLALAGKGVTFDSGGINLKPFDSLDGMKMDMAGAAAVAATMITAARLKLPVRLIAILPIVENMPSGSATRPGDIITSFSGKTIEIGNTDAEGRLILADAISYVIKNYTPHTIVDIATLTGACMVALGEKIAGLFSSDDQLAKTIFESGIRTCERCWKMPLPEDYKELLKSEIADIRNIGNSKYGGAIAAALFLSDFAENTRWAHIDIAGPAYIKKESPYCTAGGTGFGVRLLCDWIENWR